MDKINLDFTMPKGWSELSQKQLRFVYRLIAGGFTADEIKTLCLLRWNKAEVIGKESNGTYLVQVGKEHYNIKAVEIAMIQPFLDWLGSLPTLPVRLERINRRKAIAADFQGVPFETYIICDNLYQGYLQTQNDALLDELATHLYPGLKGKIDYAERINIFYWLASLKSFFSHRFSDFLQPASADNGNLLGGSPNIGAQLQESMDAQIRALTKGDVTKESEILALDTWRALTELNAQAKEYKQLKAAYNGKH